MTGPAMQAVSLRKHRVFSWAIGVLLAIAAVLSITALAKTAWMRESSHGILTSFPVPLLDKNATSVFSQEDLNSTSSMGYARYRGMRAGAFEVCYTLEGAAGSAQASIEQCFSYRTKANHLVVWQKGATKNLSSVVVSMCDFLDTSEFSFADIGIPSGALLPTFLNEFCGFKGHLTAVLQIGAIAATIVSWFAWLASAAGPASRRRVYVPALPLFAVLSFVLTLATYLLWVAAFQHPGDSSENETLGHGTSAHCTAVAIALLLAAAVVAKVRALSHVKIAARESTWVPMA